MNELQRNDPLREVFTEANREQFYGRISESINPIKLLQNKC